MLEMFGENAENIKYLVHHRKKVRGANRWRLYRFLKNQNVPSFIQLLYFFRSEAIMTTPAIIAIAPA